MISNREVSNNVNLTFIECWRMRHLAERLYWIRENRSRKRGMSLALCICCEQVSLNNLSATVCLWWEKRIQKICLFWEREKKRKNESLLLKDALNTVRSILIIHCVSVHRVPTSKVPCSLKTVIITFGKILEFCLDHNCKKMYFVPGKFELGFCGI